MQLNTLLIPSHPVLTAQLGWQRNILTKVLLCLGFAIFTFAMAQLKIRLPWTPVPITGQTLAVLLCGITLGPRLAAASIGLYLLAGISGLPVFAGFKAGWAVIVGPTGGYLLSFPLAASLVGFFASRGWDRNPLLTAIAMTAASLVIYAIGLIWLGYWLRLGGKLPGGWEGAVRTFNLGMKPFLIGDALKIVLAMVIMPSAWCFIPDRFLSSRS